MPTGDKPTTTKKDTAKTYRDTIPSRLLDTVLNTANSGPRSAHAPNGAVAGARVPHATEILRGLACSTFGSVRVSTPSFISAAIRS